MKRTFMVQDKETTYGVDYIVGSFNGEPDADVLVHHKGKPFYKQHDPKKFKSIEKMVLNLDIKSIKNRVTYSLLTGKPLKTLYILMGRGQWYHFSSKARAMKEYEWCKKQYGTGANGMELYELPIEDLPNDKLTLEELFQEHAAITKEDLPLWLSKFTDTKTSCGMIDTARWCIQGLIEGKTIWNGVPCDEEN
jgi:hypothetical protein